MIFSKVLSRVASTVSRRSLLLSAPQRSPQLPIFANEFHSLVRSLPNKLVPSQVILLQHSSLNAPSYPRLGFSSNASPDPSENSDPARVNGEANAEDVTSREAETKETSPGPESGSESAKRKRGSKRTAFSDSDSDSDPDPDPENESLKDLSRDDLLKLATEKDEILKLKQKEMEQMQDKVLRTYAEMENVLDRTRREAENSKKFAIQSFAKSLLDVADNLGRASSVVKESFSKVDTSNDSAGAVPLLKTLLEGVEMTEKELDRVFRRSGVEKFDPINEPFDPHRHNAIFQVPDNSKPPGTVAAVLKAGYMLYDRVIRPAEVGVTQNLENNNGDQE